MFISSLFARSLSLSLSSLPLSLLFPVVFSVFSLFYRSLVFPVSLCPALAFSSSFSVILSLALVFCLLSLYSLASLSFCNLLSLYAFPLSLCCLFSVLFRFMVSLSLLSLCKRSLSLSLSSGSLALSLSLTLSHSLSLSALCRSLLYSLSVVVLSSQSFFAPLCSLSLSIFSLFLSLSLSLSLYLTIYLLSLSPVSPL